MLDIKELKKYIGKEVYALQPLPQPASCRGTVTTYISALSGHTVQMLLRLAGSNTEPKTTS